MMPSGGKLPSRAPEWRSGHRIPFSFPRGNLHRKVMQAKCALRTGVTKASGHASFGGRVPLRIQVGGPRRTHHAGTLTSSFQHDQGRPPRHPERPAQRASLAVIHLEVGEVRASRQPGLHAGVRDLAVPAPRRAEFQHHRSRPCIDRGAQRFGDGVIRAVGVMTSPLRAPPSWMRRATDQCGFWRSRVNASATACFARSHVRREPPRARSQPRSRSEARLLSHVRSLYWPRAYVPYRYADR